MPKRIVSNESGQAMVFLLISLGAIMAFAAGLYITSEFLVTKIRAQNAADAAALAGAGVLADTLDVLSVSNLLRLGSVTTPTYGKAIRETTKLVARMAYDWGTVLAEARMIDVGYANGAIAVSLHKPDLEVDSSGWLDLPHFYRDKLRGRQTKNRFVRVSASVFPTVPKDLRNLVDRRFFGMILPVSAMAEAAVEGKKLTYPKFRGTLTKIPQ